MLEDVVSRGTPVWSTVNDMPYEGMDEILRLGATGILSDLPAELARLLEHIAVLRVETAAARVDELAATLHADYPRQPRQGAEAKTLARQVKRIIRVLDRDVRRPLVAGDVESTCSGLDAVRDRLTASALPTDRFDELSFTTTQIAATLACSQF
jgi:hypothetical protein